MHRRRGSDRGGIDSLLMIVSIVNAAFAVILLMILIIKKYRYYNIDQQGHQRFIHDKNAKMVMAGGRMANQVASLRD
ncbi:hypothetical protein E2562_031093 [Oryza meyeriana var. granulata]|uniref:Uncharacterized protein n=1 Tax=Oryza meyeriana var. granulata TaxID=110450 RepID=A0A6G1E4P8_9ORYZ|nr:hypothetical protein E2562_031093 [Oryza meyeriana var. granulata]